MNVDAADPPREPRAWRAGAIVGLGSRARLRRELAQQLPAVAEGFAAALRAGADQPAAMQALARCAPHPLLMAAVAPLLEGQGRAPAPERALLALRDRIGGAELTLFAHVLVVAGRSPQAQAGAFLRLARRLRARRQAEQRIAVLRGRARRVGMAAGALSLATAAAVLRLEPAAAQLLVARPVGWLLLGSLALLLLHGLVLLGRALGLDAPER